MHPQQQLALALLAYAAQRGLAVDRLARQSGLDTAALLSPTHGPLSAKQWHDLWLNAAQLARDPTFGLHFGEAATPAALGVVGQLVQSSRTVGEALTHGAALLPLLTDQVWLDLAHSPQSVWLRFRQLPTELAASATVVDHLVDFVLAFVLHELDGLLLERLQPRTVRFPPGARQLPEHLRVLRAATLAAGPPGEYSVELAGACWSMPLLTADYELQAALLQKITQWQAARPAVEPLRDKIAGYLLANAYLGIPSLEELAANFSTSARSLQRKLQAEGTNYQEVADAVRKSLALHYLKMGAYPIKEISYLMGYNELSAFSRAFKRWTGHSPAHYQPASASRSLPG
ncbi:AraC family transcriptional regulator [Hymenobacter negativus]|uniref:AraC family transcriptional regulator ligand-binding domain-containing protein n=1 Tax=Hymenobacter negativus TaxID=2795026 RepID=A0ABS3QQD1_9BACT|nr:AraC family transcriptional regulator [Hymenobacter negativus]MBO2012969.1 AraC family transcriptional regulator ligand-binding domain-containing protein [Hymenobacter negativus]